jgi:hypothetical protein
LHLATTVHCYFVVMATNLVGPDTTAVKCTVALMVSLLGCLLAEPPLAAQAAFSYQGLKTRVPVVREHTYILNARVRPLLLFWIGRDNIGDARLTWHQSPGGRRAFEFLVGSDPARAPRRINRWGFIVEELNADTAEILGVMSESSEETLEEAKAQVARQDDVKVFKASRTTIAATKAVNGTMTVRAPAHLTYQNLDELLGLLPATPPNARTIEVPPGVSQGFLIAMDGLIRASVEPCRTEGGGGPRRIAPLRYLYNQTFYDVSLVSCRHAAAMPAHGGTATDLIDGRFRITNRTTKHNTDFRIVYGASGALKEVPVRAFFRPRWWMEVELVLNQSTERAL